MKNKYYLGIGIIVVFFAIMVYLFTQSTVSYESNFENIRSKPRTFKATGAWVREKSYEMDNASRTFTFFMKDTSGHEMKVIYSGVMPNNFETATSVVATGKYKNDAFYATELLTKCPSKYEARKTASQ